MQHHGNQRCFISTTRPVQQLLNTGKQNLQFGNGMHTDIGHELCTGSTCRWRDNRFKFCLYHSGVFCNRLIAYKPLGSEPENSCNEQQYQQITYQHR